MGKDPQDIREIDDLANLPVVQDGKNIWQNKWHIHDVFDHTVKVVEILRYKLNASPEMQAVGWLHDVGKPSTRIPKYENGNLQTHLKSGEPYHSFHGHEIVGEAIVRSLPPVIFRNLGIDQDYVARIVGYHFLPLSFVKRMKKGSSFSSFQMLYHELASQLAKTGMKEDVFTIFHADKLAQKSKDIKFLLALRQQLIKGETELRALFASFLRVYDLDVKEGD